MTISKNIRLGVSPLTKSVFAGRVNKAGVIWVDKVDVTQDFLNCVVEYFTPGTKNIISSEGEPLLVVEVRKFDQEKDG